jgi:hypothetical protein
MCAMLIAGALVSEIFACGFEREKCPYIKIKEPDEPVKETYPAFPMDFSTMAIGTTASTVMFTSGLGQHVGDTPDGGKIVFFKPKDINLVGGTFKIIKNDGNETTIDFV